MYMFFSKMSRDYLISPVIVYFSCKLSFAMSKKRVSIRGVVLKIMFVMNRLFNFCTFVSTPIFWLALYCNDDKGFLGNQPSNFLLKLLIRLMFNRD